MKFLGMVGGRTVLVLLMCNVLQGKNPLIAYIYQVSLQTIFQFSKVLLYRFITGSGFIKRIDLFT